MNALIVNCHERKHLPSEFKAMKRKCICLKAQQVAHLSAEGNLLILFAIIVFFNSLWESKIESEKEIKLKNTTFDA